jgi:hypothetical protein
MIENRRNGIMYRSINGQGLFFNRHIGAFVEIILKKPIHDNNYISLTIPFPATVETIPHEFFLRVLFYSDFLSLTKTAIYCILKRF